MDPLDRLRARLDPSCLTTQPDELAPHLADWRGRYTGRARALVRPRTVEEVSIILAWAASERVPVVPQGGNTGLAGGATPDDSGRAVVLALGGLDRVRTLDAAGGTMTVEAGCILAEVQRRALAAGRLFPMSLGSEGSCQIGGTIATNAGGINALRYGTMRDLVLGLEYVLPGGAVVSDLKGLRKDNAGYDLRHLVIGSEGTLAVVTAAVLKLFPQPCNAATALCGVNDAARALDLLSRLRSTFAERVTSFELMCDGEMGLIASMMPQVRYPLAQRHPWYVFVEIADSEADAPLAERLTAALAEGIESGLVADGVVAQSGAQAKAIWHLRFAVSECNRRAGYSVSHDTSVAVADVPAFLAAVTAMLEEVFPEARPLFVGHMGDGNIHVNVLFPDPPPAERRPALAAAVNDRIFAIVRAFGGSITAEHGIGLALRGRLPGHTDPAAYELMQGIKRLFDPHGILNPGKVLP